MRRIPGRDLAAAWDGQGLPPVHALPPEVGLPALECTWPYHFKESFGTLLGARCNHDVGVLGRLPVLPADVAAQLQGPSFRGARGIIPGTVERHRGS